MVVHPRRPAGEDEGRDVVYQSGGIGAIDAEDGHGGLDIAGSGGGEGPDGDSGAEGLGALGSGSPPGVPRYLPSSCV